MDMAVEYCLIKKSGAWFSYNGEKIGQGRDNTRKYMQMNKEFTDDIEMQIRELMAGQDKNNIVEMDNEGNSAQKDDIDIVEKDENI